MENSLTEDAQLRKLLSRTDWTEIQELLRKKAYQRKFQIIEAYMALVSKRGIHKVTYADIATECGIDRQLVAHHFPKDQALIILAYRFIYAGFQKHCSDKILARSGFLNRMDAYVEGIVSWAIEQKSHSRFLIQFYALVQLDPELATILERNVAIGSERITALLVSAQKEGFFVGQSKAVLARKAAAAQMLGFGFLLSQSWKDLEVKRAHRELLDSWMALLGAK
jgi:AcrR family transcriptional regulator